MSIADIDQDEDIYPSSDGQPMAETPEHLLLMVAMISALRHYYKKRHDVYAIGNMFLYYRKGDTKARRAPDIMVVKGVDPALRRRSFKIWEEKAVPAVIFELTSRETAEEDLQIKLPLYEELRVKEYFLFDPLNEYLPRQLMGFRLVNDCFQELTPDSDDALVSEELSLRLVPRGADLLLFDLATGEQLLGHEELHDLLDEMRRHAEETLEELREMEQATLEAKQNTEKQRRLAEQEKQRADLQKQLTDQEKLRADQEKLRADQEKLRADQEKLRADQEKLRAYQEMQRAEQEKQRADALAAEVARLRAAQNPPPP